MTNDECVRIFDNILGLGPISAPNHCKWSKATTMCGLKCFTSFAAFYLQMPPAYRNVIFKFGMFMGSRISMQLIKWHLGKRTWKFAKLQKPVKLTLWRIMLVYLRQLFPRLRRFFAWARWCQRLSSSLSLPLLWVTWETLVNPRATPFQSTNNFVTL